MAHFGRSWDRRRSHLAPWSEDNRHCGECGHGAERRRLWWKKATTGGDGGSGDGKKTVKVGLAYDIGGRGDKSFNDAAYAGLRRSRAS